MQVTKSREEERERKRLKGEKFFLYGADVSAVALPSSFQIVI